MNSETTLDYASQVNEVERRIASLRTSIHQLEVEQSNHSRDARAWSSSLRRSQAHSAYSTFLLWFRSPISTFSLWPLAVLSFGPTAVAAFFFVVVHSLSGSMTGALSTSGTLFLISLATLTAFLFLPPTGSILAQQDKVKQAIDAAKNALAPIQEHLDTLGGELRSQRNELKSLESSVVLRRKKLLQRNWRNLKGIEWEDYLAEVCSALGARVQLTMTSGDQGVDLIVLFGERRVAIQAKGWSDNVGNKAVMEVVAGKQFYNCDICAVICNSHFTAPAIELAQKTNCKLIDEDNFERFALGDISL